MRLVFTLPEKALFGNELPFFLFLFWTLTPPICEVRNKRVVAKKHHGLFIARKKIRDRSSARQESPPHEQCSTPSCDPGESSCNNEKQTNSFRYFKFHDWLQPVVRRNSLEDQTETRKDFFAGGGGGGGGGVPVAPPPPLYALFQALRPSPQATSRTVSISFQWFLVLQFC